MISFHLLTESYQEKGLLRFSDYVIKIRKNDKKAAGTPGRIRADG